MSSIRYVKEILKWHLKRLFEQWIGSLMVTFVSIKMHLFSMARRFKFLFLFTILLSSTQLTLAQERVNWLEMDKALALAEEENKKIFIDMYTDWCTWCKKMDRSTFQRSDIATYINQTFIPVKFNAEQKGEITYQDQVYKYVNYGKRGYHQLAAELSKSLGKLSFPTIIFLDENQNVIQPIPGFQDPKSFEVIMHFIGEDHFKSRPFKAFSANFRGNYN